MRRRAEVCERTFAHLMNTGGMRRTWLRGLLNVAKRYHIQAAAYNLGLVMRSLIGIGKPKGLSWLLDQIHGLFQRLHTRVTTFLEAIRHSTRFAEQFSF